jgi:hypothetical protein
MVDVLGLESIIAGLLLGLFNYSQPGWCHPFEEGPETWRKK